MFFVRTPPAVAGQTTEHLEIVGIGMAGRTVIPGVPARGDGKPGVIESSLVPGCVGGSMTRFAGRRKSSGHMARVARLFVVGPMASVTFSGCPGINSINMTGRAVQSRVDSLKSKKSTVIRIRLVPRCVGSLVAQFTGRRISGGYMVRVACLLVVCSVTTIAFRGSAFIDVVLVAGTAVQCRVHTLEREDTAVAEIG